MFENRKDQILLAMIRNGRPMTAAQKLRLIVSLSLPSMMAQVSSILMFYIDASMVGSLGAAASASVGLVESTLWLFSGLTSAAAMGFSVQAAHFAGAGDFKKARTVFRQGIMATVIFTLLLTMVCLAIARPLPYWLGGGSDIAPDASKYFAIYCCTLPLWQVGILSSSMLKCTGNMRIPSVTSVMMCVFDVVFNFLFIFPTRPISLLGLDITMPGAGLGVPGAALGTALAFVVSDVIVIWFATVRSRELALRQDKWELRPLWSYLKSAAKISFPMGAQYIMMSGAQIVSTMIVAPLGNIAIAANTFAITAESLCYMPGYGIGEAATTLVGQSIGAGQRRLARSFAFRTVFLGMIVMAFMGFVMYIGAPFMMSTLTPVNEIRTLGADVLRIEAWAEPMFAAAIVAYDVCLGAGDTLVPACMNLASMWLVRLTLAASLAPQYGLRGVWIAMAAELTFRGTIFLIRLFSGKWNKRKV